MQEDKEELFELADSYFKSTNGFEKDYSKAMLLYKKSAKLGNARAMYMIGYMYHYGLGVDKDFKEAFYWFTKADSNGNTDGKEFLDLYCLNGFNIWR